MPVAQENEPMRVIYRMRGLLGDATEEFIETLTNKDSENQDEEDIYKMGQQTFKEGKKSIESCLVFIFLC